MEKIWKDIVGYEGLYQINNFGEIMSIKSGLLRKQQLNCKGYPVIKLNKNNVTTGYIVHRLVAQAFINNPDNKEEVNHKDSVRHNNRVNNLEWVTRSENLKHSYREGNKLPNTPIGEKCPWAKLTEKDVKLIKQMKFVDPELKPKIIADYFKTNIGNIYSILGGYNWKHIKI